jgi:nucleotidyltransferase substrate binding protein (TIGR01987 family)
MTEEITILNGKIVITPLVDAFKTFREGFEEAETRLEKDGVIQRFEYCYELTWKTLKKILEYKGITVRNPRDTFREAAYQGLINDTELWFNVVEKRNLTVHTYKEAIVLELDEMIEKVINEMGNLINKLKAL